MIFYGRKKSNSPQCCFNVISIGYESDLVSQIKFESILFHYFRLNAFLQVTIKKTIKIFLA